MVLLNYILDVSNISYRNKGEVIKESNIFVNIAINNSSEIEIGSILSWTPLSYFKYKDNELSCKELEIYITLRKETNQDFINSIALEDYSNRILGIIRKNGPDGLKKDFSKVSF